MVTTPKIRRIITESFHSAADLGKLNTSSTAQTKTFSLAAALGGMLPYASKIIIKNDSGAALAASGNSVYYSEISATVA